MNYRKFASAICALCILGASAPLAPASGYELIAHASSSDNNINFTAIGQYTVISVKNSDETPTWYSDNTNVATVDSNGKVTAVGEGTCNIHAVFSNQVLTCMVTVELPDEPTDIYVGDLTLSNEQIAAKPTLSIDTSGAVWTSSDTSVATVDSSGTITAVGSGNCTVTASVGGKNYIIKVTSTYVPTTTEPVTEVHIGDLTLTNEQNAFQVSLGDQLPEGTVIYWYSTDTSVAEVTQEGLITAKGSGSCRIIAEINGVKYITQITSTYTPDDSEKVYIIGEVQLTNQNPSAQITLDGADQAVEWKSSDESVAVVDNSGKITAVGSGSCEIYAYIGSTRNVVKVTSTYVPVSEPVLKIPADEIKGIGNTLQLELLNTGDSAVSWISTDVNVATVNSNGLVTAVGAGTVKIIASAGGKTYTAEITVTADKIVYGDADCNGTVEITDVVKIMTHLTTPEGILSDEGKNNADVYQRGDGIGNMDALAVQKKIAQLITELPESYM